MSSTSFALRLGLALALTGAFSLALPEPPALAQARPRGKKKKKKKAEAAPPPAPGTAAGAGMALGNVAQQQKSAERERIDAAIQQFKEERYGPAAVVLHDVMVAAETPAPLRDEARYHLAKSLYRLGLHHGALTHFGALLSGGPGSPFYGPSLEWCLFVARKVVADDRVLELIARYSDGNFPEEYESEFHYLLARHHYVQAQTMDSGSLAKAAGAARTEETVTGGKSISGDVFGDVFGDDAPAKDDAPEISREGKGVSVEEDIFGFDDEPAAPKAAPEKKKEPEAPAPAPVGDGELTSKEHLEAANRAIGRVKATSGFAARAKYLEAVLHYKDGRDNDALEAFKSVVRLTKEGSPQEDTELRQLALFQLARTHFGAKQPSFSLFYYDKMDRFTYEWLEALYESSWAEFRLGNYEKSLGNLLTLHSPFFRDEYFPESHILNAVVYYENCRYPEAKEILTRFMKRYEPVLDELGKLTARQQEPEKYYEILSNLREGESAGLTEERARIISQILTIALADPELEKLDASFREVEDELGRFDGLGEVFQRSALKPDLMKSVGGVRDDLRRAAGRAVKRRLEQEREAIKRLVAQAVRIDIETAAAEQARIESTLRGVDQAPKKAKNQFVEWTDDEKLVWPFEGEYWRDELGTYELTLADTCR
jgi:tetratricopeptide (TPR) repeat protein